MIYMLRVVVAVVWKLHRIVILGSTQAVEETLPNSLKICNNGILVNK